MIINDNIFVVNTTKKLRDYNYEKTVPIKVTDRCISTVFVWDVALHEVTYTLKCSTYKKGDVKGNQWVTSSYPEQ